MVILGIDPSSSVCGWAIYDTDKPVSAIITGNIKPKGDTPEQKSAFLGRDLVALVKRHGRPDFVAIEAPMRTAPAARRNPKRSLLEGVDELQQPAVQGLGALAITNQMVGALMGVIGAYGLPFEVLAPRTWRKAFLGSFSHSKMDRQAWKKAARARCDMLKISVNNMDEAEAAGISFAGASTQTFKMLTVQGRAA